MDTKAGRDAFNALSEEDQRATLRALLGSCLYRLLAEKHADGMRSSKARVEEIGRLLPAESKHLAFIVYEEAANCDSSFRMTEEAQKRKKH